MCQFVLSILPIRMVVLSFGITNGRFFSCVSVFVLLGNSKSVCEKVFILSNCFFTSERLYPLLIRLFLSVVSFSSSSSLSVVIFLYLRAWLYMIPFCSFLDERSYYVAMCIYLVVLRTGCFPIPLSIAVYGSI